MGISVVWNNSQPQFITSQHHECLWYDSVEVQGAEWLLVPSVYYYLGSNYPPEPSTPEPWEVGIIQNVIEERVSATYLGMPPLLADSRTFVRSALLDAERPGTQAWMFAAPQICPPGLPFTLLRNGDHLITSVRVSYGAGSMTPWSFSLLAFDAPRNVWNTSWRRDRVHWLQRLELHLRFRFWIAAKRVSAPSNDPASYYILQVSDPWSVGYTIDVTGTDPCSRPLAAGAAAAGMRRRPVSGSIFVRSNPATFNVRIRAVNHHNSHTPQPIVRDPVANDSLSPMLINMGMGPRYRNPFLA